MARHTQLEQQPLPAGSTGGQLRRADRGQRHLVQGRALATVEKETEFTNFAAGMESIHDQVHAWVGGRRGTMSQLDRAPADPLCWMHRVNIDRLWWDWHNSPNPQG